MSHSNDNVASRERAGQAQAETNEPAAETLKGREQPSALAAPSFYPHAAREFVESTSLYEGGVSAEPPPPGVW